MQRVGEETKVGAPSPAAAMAKYYGTEHNKLRYELMLEAMGTQGVGWDGEADFPWKNCDYKRLA